MTLTALQFLSHDWQAWVAENLARSCDPQIMAEQMARDGRYHLTLARAAIEEARLMSMKQAVPGMPDIDTSQNAIQTSDRSVDILLKLDKPRIILLGNVLSGEECDALAAHCEGRLSPSPMVSNDDGSLKYDQQRTSRGTMMRRDETPLITRVDARLAEIARWPVERSEGMQVQQYQVTNEYRAHFDWFDPNMPGPRKHLEHGGQRLATFVLYLSDVEAGGGTAFPEIGLEILPKKGGAVFFQNTDSQYVPDRRTLHAGSPVTKGVKFIANKWLRERKY